MIKQINAIGLIGALVNLCDFRVPEIFLNPMFSGHPFKPHDIRHTVGNFNRKVCAGDLNGRSMLDKRFHRLISDQFIFIKGAGFIYYFCLGECQQ